MSTKYNECSPLQPVKIGFMRIINFFLFFLFFLFLLVLLLSIATPLSHSNDGSILVIYSMVHATLMLITPLLRAKIVDALPHELGLLLKTLPSPFEIFGEFSVKGEYCVPHALLSVLIPTALRCEQLDLIFYELQAVNSMT
jgi:hypothetical protein